MFKKALFIIMAASLLLAYSDYDMDGVKDAIDKCPNTSFNELVDIEGCTIKVLGNEHHFSIIYGIGLSEADYVTVRNSGTLTQSLQIDYYYQNFSFQASTSYYDSDEESGLNDSFIGVYYKLSPSNELTLRIGSGVLLPTYDTELDNNNMDVVTSASFSYMLKKINLFGNYSYTMVNDNDILGIVTYQDTHSYSGGAGFYALNDLYVSSYYTASNSIYKDTEEIETLSFYVFYAIDANWFTTFSYSHGLSNSASDSALTLRIGYNF
ncbi:MAG: DUF3187 domain-containing protein [Sulfurimonas sp.]|jgi:hypothetical protein